MNQVCVKTQTGPIGTTRHLNDSKLSEEEHVGNVSGTGVGVIVAQETLPRLLRIRSTWPWRGHGGLLPKLQSENLRPRHLPETRS